LSAIELERPDSIVIAASKPRHSEDAYAQLKLLMKQQRLFEYQPLYYALHGLMAIGLVVASLLLAIKAESFALRCLAALLMAVTTTHLGLLGHDLGHRQVFTRPYLNDLVMLIMGPLVGVSRTWWVDTHNRHHAHPNDLDLDPHLQIPLLAFSPSQTVTKQGWLKHVVPYQAYYFVPLLFLEGIGTKLASVITVLTGRTKLRLVEGASLIIHLVGYTILLSTMPLFHALAVAVIHQALLGLYWGLIFAPNHKGMETFEGRARSDFLTSQVLSSRNIAPGAITDWAFGGLNYQIEHHLFPNMPRNCLRKARPIVRQFCAERGLAYCERSVIGSYVDVLRFLANASRIPGRRQ
jgi:fatty acid desaturase